MTTDKNYKALQRWRGSNPCIFGLSEQKTPAQEAAEATGVDLDVMEAILRECGGPPREVVLAILRVRKRLGLKDPTPWLTALKAASRGEPAHKVTQVCVDYFGRSGSLMARWVLR